MIKKKNLTLILMLCINSFLFAQFEVNFIAPTDTNVCQDTVMFIVSTTNGGNTVAGVNYTWSFDDGTKINGTDLDTVKHIFIKGGGYVVRVDAEKAPDKDYALQKIQVALKANFEGTKAEQEEAMCLGQTSGLNGVASSVTWIYNKDKNIEQNPVLINNNQIYTSVFDYRIFNETDVILNSSDIDTIAVKIEHSNLSNLKIELFCPNNNSIILKDFGGEDKYFGLPNSSTAYWYYWTNSPENGTINSTIPTGASMPEGSYTPDQAFSSLSGCLLNGEWTIKITDNLNPDSGYVYTTRLKFSQNILPPEWTFTNTYSKYVWSGPGVSNTLPNGSASATPITKGSSEYKFNVTDNFSCAQDTSIFLQVTPAGFTANPIEGPFDLEVNFQNTTTWSNEYLWDFGDGTDKSTEENPTHTYTYPAGRYKVLFTATANDGCFDTDTITIDVTIPEAVFNEPPNVFSPNGDGFNDFLKLDVEHFASFEAWIYSRWGKLVKKWNNIDEAKTGWDGKIQDSNRDAAPGVYYFYIKAVDFYGQEVFKKGSFQLFR